ncbi:MAG: lipid-A-disaccharide synthase [Candidatus Omnitrophica bacterium]|nr:lipid-A-disaccharide synthase [Candidatus Omnitrophota bacterium]
MAEKHLFIICGEASGDLNAANLVKAIKQIAPQTRFSCVGGDFLRKEDAEIIYDIKGLSVMGFFDVLKKLPAFFGLKKIVLDKITAQKPDAIILVDFSGFNLRLAKAINGIIPVIYYVSPQVWASRAGRVQTIKKFISKMVVLFKFEGDFYKKFGVNVDFAGHPLLDIVKPSQEKNEFLKQNGLAQGKLTIALLPGSRKQEIRKILPVMLKSALLIMKTFPEAQFVIAKSTQVDWEIYNNLIKNLNLNLKIIEGKTYDCLNAADFALVCSGTATLETAIMQKPFVIIYKMSLLNYLLYRPQVKLPYIGMVNIVAGKKIIPEFIQFKAKPKEIAAETVRILNNSAQLIEMKNALCQIKSSLGEPGASSRAAKIITDFINK